MVDNVGNPFVRVSKNRKHHLPVERVCGFHKEAVFEIQIRQLNVGHNNELDFFWYH